MGDPSDPEQREKARLTVTASRAIDTFADARIARLRDLQGGKNSCGPSGN